jgi:hypothetical protein
MKYNNRRNLIILTIKYIHIILFKINLIIIILINLTIVLYKINLTIILYKINITIIIQFLISQTKIIQFLINLIIKEKIKIIK